MYIYVAKSITVQRVALLLRHREPLPEVFMCTLRKSLSHNPEREQLPYKACEMAFLRTGLF